jgi:diguanylate cyclase (GGDEF)-like protein
MVPKVLLPIAAVVSLVPLLVTPPVTGAAGPLPDVSPGVPPGVPALPDTPTVGVTPGNGGASAEIGVGDTAIQVGAGPGGVNVGTRSRGSKPGATSPTDSMPVGTPGDRPGRRLRAVTGGPGAVVYGAAATRGRAVRLDGKTAGAGRGNTNATPGKARRGLSLGGSAPGGRQNSRLAPFFELIDRVPPVVWAGVALLGLIALGIWGAWVRTRRRLEGNAFVDPVTGIANAAAFEGLLDRELERAKRYKRPLALVLLEVGAPEHTGLLTLRDATLRAVTAAIRERIREGDTIARLGASRFAVISPEATAGAAETLARALELRLEELRVHVAVGTAERQPTDLGPQDLLARTEAELVQSAVPEDEPARLRPALRAA